MLHDLRSDAPTVFSMRSEFIEQMNRQIKYTVCSISSKSRESDNHIISFDFYFKWIADMKTRRVIAMKRSKVPSMSCAHSFMR